MLGEREPPKEEREKVKKKKIPEPERRNWRSREESEDEGKVLLLTASVRRELSAAKIEEEQKKWKPVQEVPQHQMIQDTQG